MSHSTRNSVCTLSAKAHDSAENSEFSFNIKADLILGLVSSRVADSLSFDETCRVVACIVDRVYGELLRKVEGSHVERAWRLAAQRARRLVYYPLIGSMASLTPAQEELVYEFTMRAFRDVGRDQVQWLDSFGD